MTRLWSRVPTIVAAPVAGIAVGALITLPWAYLVSLNVKHGSSVPWAAAVTLPLLWLWWRYFGGAWAPQSTSGARQALMRALPISDDAWGAAIMAGMLGIGTSLLLLSVTNRLVHVPQGDATTYAGIPMLTLLLSNVVGATVAGVAEEGAFRGYMQGPLERHYGPVMALVVTGLIFASAHFTHPGVLPMLPFYFAIATTYGLMTYFTGSILPSLVLHAVGDAMGGLAAIMSGGNTTSTVPLPAMVDKGIDSSFWLLVLALVVVGAATMGAFRSLATITRKTSSPAAC